MSLWKLTAKGLRAGVWEGELAGGAGVPKLDALHGDRALAGVEVAKLPGEAGRFAVRVPIPADALSDGVQSFLVCHEGETLAQFAVIAGVPMEEDLRAEVEVLRAELDLLKRAFRRHCVETAT